MAKSNRLIRRESTYYFRRKIPADLLGHYSGKREIVRSLRTKDHDEAARIARRVSVELDQEWQALRRFVPAELRPEPIPAERMDLAYWDEAASQVQAEETVAHWDADDEQQEQDERLADQLERAYAIVERRRAGAGQAPYLARHSCCCGAVEGRYRPARQGSQVCAIRPDTRNHHSHMGARQATHRKDCGRGDPRCARSERPRQPHHYVTAHHRHARLLD